jgi:RNA polymerase sigma-70 factor (ECF subfamily)
MNDKRRHFEATVLPHLDAAYRFARWLADTPADAEDVVQEACLRAYRSFEGWRGSDIKGWLFAIIRNCHLTAIEQERRRGFVPLPEHPQSPADGAMHEQAPDPETRAIHDEAERTLDRLVFSLPEQHREVLVLRELEELNYREIAAVTMVPIGTVMSRLARARAALRERWQRELAGESHALP